MSRSLERISKLCAEPFASFRRHEKKGKERLEKEYKFKAVRLKTTYKYKGRHAGLPLRLHNILRGFNLPPQLCCSSLFEKRDSLFFHLANTFGSYILQLLKQCLLFTFYFFLYSLFLLFRFLFIVLFPPFPAVEVVT